MVFATNEENGGALAELLYFTRGKLVKFRHQRIGISG